MYLRKGVLRICCKFTGEHPCWIVISIKLQSGLVRIYFFSGKIYSNGVEAKYLILQSFLNRWNSITCTFVALELKLLQAKLKRHYKSQSYKKKTYEIRIHAKSTYFSVSLEQFEQSNKTILVFRTSKFNMSLTTPITTFREILDGFKFKRQLQLLPQHNLLNGYKIKKIIW